MTKEEKKRFVAHDKWDREFFAKRSGEAHYRNTRNPTFFNIPSDSVWDIAHFFVLRTCSWAEFVDKIQNKKEHVLISGIDAHLRTMGNSVVDKWKDCWIDIQPGLDEFVPGGTKSDDIDIVGLWLSGSGISCQTHWDIIGDHNLLFQIKGKKRFLLWEPMDGQEHLYPVPFRFWHTSRIPDPYNVDLQQFPLYRHAKTFATEMKEGDILYVPARWWHHVTHDGDFNMNIACWYASQYRLRKPHPIKTWCVPRPISGFFLLLKVVVAVLLAMFLMFKQKLL